MKIIKEYGFEDNIFSFAVSDRRKDIILSTEKGEIVCMDINGKVKWNSKLNKRALLLTANRGDNTIAVPVGPLSHMKSIYCYDNCGVLTWKFKTPFGYMIFDVDMDDFGNKTIVGAYDTLICVDNTGKIVWKEKQSNWKQVRNIIDVSISADGNLIVAVCGYHIIVLDDNRKKLLQHRNKKNISPYQTKISNDGRFIVVRGAIGLGITKGLIYSIGFEGNLLWERQFSFVPESINLSTNKKYIIAKHSDDLYFFDKEGKSLGNINIKNCKMASLSTEGSTLYSITENKLYCYDISSHLKGSESK